MTCGWNCGAQLGETRWMPQKIQFSEKTHQSCETQILKWGIKLLLRSAWHEDCKITHVRVILQPPSPKGSGTVNVLNVMDEGFGSFLNSHKVYLELLLHRHWAEEIAGERLTNRHGSINQINPSLGCKKWEENLSASRIMLKPPDGFEQNFDGNSWKMTL